MTSPTIPPCRPLTLRTVTATRRNASILPAELFFSVFEHLRTKRELCMLAATSRILQRPAEACLYQSVILSSRNDVERFCTVLQQVPRFAPLVRSLTIEWPISRGELDEKYRLNGIYREEYWGRVRDTLEDLIGLEELTIEDGRDHFLSWVLERLGSEKLKALRCGFVLDESFLRFLKRQNALKELSWTGSLLSIPSGITITEKPNEAEESSSIEQDAELPIVRIFRSYLGNSSLRNLNILHTESLALARALVPGRRITHLWVPGTSFATAYTSDYIYSHIPVPSQSDSYSHSRTTSTSTTTIPNPPINSTLKASANLQSLSDAQIAGQLCRALRDFAQSKGPIMSLRLSLGLTDGALRDVLGCISQCIPSVKALGFLPAGVVDSSTFPLLPNLHTLTLWSLPSPRALDALTSSPSLPSLKTVACLHFSPSFEWICLPVNDDASITSTAESRSTSFQSDRDTGGIQWDRSATSDTGSRGQRRPTAVHDPRNLLWRDV